jgi:hypothetical protein
MIAGVSTVGIYREEAEMAERRWREFKRLKII